METQTLLNTILALAPGATARENADRPAVDVPSEELHELMRRLQSDPQLQFKMLLAHTAVDWPERGTIELLYFLSSPEQGLDFLVATCVPRENPVAPSVSDIWTIAEWQEREVYDMFGVLYDGHPDLRRLLLVDEWVGHPLRRDYQDDFMLERPV